MAIIVSSSAIGSANHNPASPNSIGIEIKQIAENINPRKIVKIVAFNACSVLCINPMATILNDINKKAGEKYGSP